MDFVTADMFDRLGAVVTVIAFALAIITDKLVWHTRLKKEVARADRWEKVALEALSAGALAGIRAAEVAADVVGAIPDPELQRRRSQAQPPHERGN